MDNLPSIFIPPYLAPNHMHILSHPVYVLVLFDSGCVYLVVSFHLLVVCVLFVLEWSIDWCPLALSLPLSLHVPPTFLLIGIIYLPLTYLLLNVHILFSNLWRFVFQNLFRYGCCKKTGGVWQDTWNHPGISTEHFNTHTNMDLSMGVVASTEPSFILKIMVWHTLAQGNANFVHIQYHLNTTIWAAVQAHVRTTVCSSFCACA